MTAAPGQPERLGLDALPDDLEEAVLQALELEPAAAAAAIDALCTAQPAHAARIRAWIAAAGAGAEPAVPAAPAAGPGAVDAELQELTDYRVLAVLGRGGFGTVWLAEQLHPLRRHVAIKVINPGMDSREVLARFAAEREALNRMDHPGIARLLDAGALPSGRPYFVMEYVPGVALAVWCRRRDLPVRARLELFLLVLDAVQHAHQKAVLHRDLSTNNVLVCDQDGRPQPKIIDFGIAKSLAAPLQGIQGLTFQGTLMGTPEFMSPEQAQGRTADIDTRADIYALGVQLFELLTDELPIPSVVLRAEGIAGIARIVRTHPVPLASQAAPAARQAQLRGDLDWIVGKALSKERDLRYASVSEFAADLRRHLRHEPVLASPPSTLYRLRKFARRNRAVVGLAAVATAAVLALSWFAWWSKLAADAARAETEQARQELQRRADAGFRLLANQERLQQAAARERELGPPWPQQVPALRAWLADYGRPVRDELPRMQEKLDELRPRAAQNRFADPAERHLWQALLRLEAEARAFCGPGGSLPRVEQSLQWAETVAQRSLVEHAAAWQEAVRAVRDSDGVQAAAAYRGLQLAPQVGLIPLGPDPHSRLWEFLDLASHGDDEPVPGRDRRSGELLTRARTGMVFVLVPPGEFWIGANRGEPGLEQYDPDALDDELPSQPVMLDAFLIAKTELTGAQWGQLQRRPLHEGLLMPAVNIDWDTASLVLRRWGMDLSTEAQWEYACRAGTRTPWYCGRDPEAVTALGNFGPRLQPVGLYPPNDFGLHDLLGNAAEWCRDWKAPYTGSARLGSGLVPMAKPGEFRVVRGGACTDGPRAARSSARGERSPQQADALLSLRPVRELRRG